MSDLIKVAYQLDYQNSIKAIEEWSVKLNVLKGTKDSPETLNGLMERINLLTVTTSIFEVLDEQRRARARLQQMDRPGARLTCGSVKTENL